MIKILFLQFLFTPIIVAAQNIGIGTPTPSEKLEVVGNIKASGLRLSTGGAAYDFLVQSDATGQVGVKKGHGALAIHYIIAVQGVFPSTNPPMATTPMIGEVKLFAGNYAPNGWMFCEGQVLQINSPYNSLFAIIGTTYGGDGRTTFALPDLRGAAPVHPGTSTAGYSWFWGERTY